MDAIVLAYYEAGKPDWMKDNLLPLVLSEEMIDALSDIAKDAFLKESAEYAKLDLEKIFTPGNEALLSACDESGFIHLKHIRLNLLRLIVNIFKEQGKPAWMENMLRQMFTRAELMQFANIGNLLKGLAKKHKFSESKAMKDTLTPL